MRKIYDEAQLLAECKKYKEVYIYGAGMVGGLVVGHLRNICSCFDGKINLKGLIISRRTDDIVYSYGLPLYQFAEIESILKNREVLVLVSVIEEKQIEIQRFLEIKKVNNVACLSDDCIKELLRIREQGNAAVIHRINELENSIVRLIPRPILNVSYHLTDVCNLNCKGCWHFAPLATAMNKDQRADVEEFERDVKRLSELLEGEMAKFSLFGGEPLLHEEAYKFPYIVKKYFPNTSVDFVTNGVLIPKQKEEFWQSCIDNDVEIQWTKYPISENKLAEIEETFKSRDVKWKVFGDGDDKYLSHAVFDLDAMGGCQRNGNDPRWQWMHCWKAGWCVQLRNQKLYPCCDAATADIFKEYFKLDIVISPNDGIDIYKAQSKEQVFEFLSKPIPFCRYCNVQKATDGHEWSVSERKIEEWT